MRNEDNMINCNCGSCFHKSYKTRHLKSKVHIEGLKKKEEVKTIELKIKNDELLEKKTNKLSIKYIDSIIDFDCRDNILIHENIEELHEELNRYFNRFVNNKCNEAQLNYDCCHTIKEFVEKNNIKYNYDIFSEYISVDPYDLDNDDLE